MRAIKLTFAVMFWLGAVSTVAAPAAWYQWRSKLEPVLLCAQTSPGDGWEKSSGPYLDAHCEKMAAHR